MTLIFNYNAIKYKTLENFPETETEFCRSTPKFLTNFGLTHLSFNIYLETINMLREILKRFRHGSYSQRTFSFWQIMHYAQKKQIHICLPED